MTKTLQWNKHKVKLVIEWWYQEFQQPEARLVVEGLEGVDEEEEEEAIES